jgi:hypothetical protein
MDPAVINTAQPIKRDSPHEEKVLSRVRSNEVCGAYIPRKTDRPRRSIQDRLRMTVGYSRTGKTGTMGEVADPNTIHSAQQGETTDTRETN